MAKFHDVGENHVVIVKQMREMEGKLQAEQQGGAHPWFVHQVEPFSAVLKYARYEVFTGPRML